MAFPSQVSFSVPQRIIHWAMALLIFFNLVFPDGMEHAYRLMRRGETLTPEQISSANIHAYVGFAVLFLAVLRLCLRFFQGVPPHPPKNRVRFRSPRRLRISPSMPCSSSCLCPVSLLIISVLSRPDSCIPVPSRR